MKNKLPLKIHCFFSNVLGTLLLIYAGISCSLVFYRLLFYEHINYIETIRTLLWLLHTFFLGLLLLGVSQFLRHVSGQTDSRGWILRRGELVIYLAILVTIVQAIWGLSTMDAICSSSGCSLAPGAQKYIVNAIFGATMVFVKVLIMFGIAQSLRAMMHSSSKKLLDSD